jgi:DNA transformation protein
MRTASFVSSDLKRLRNIGRTIERSLNQIGIYSKFQLDKIGAVDAVKKLQSIVPKEAMDLYYFLYALEGALLDLDWWDIPEKLKYHLRKQAGLQA